MEDYYRPMEWDLLFPGLDLDDNYKYPTPAPWPIPRSPGRQTPSQPALAHSFPTRTSATNHSTYQSSTAPDRRGPEQNVPARGQTSRRSDEGLLVCREKVDRRTCGQKFKRSKDFARHKETIHPPEHARPFVCWCGKSDYRCDNHRRHVKSCRPVGRTARFVCNQGHGYSSKTDYLNHLQDADGCGRLAGRARTSAP